MAISSTSATTYERRPIEGSDSKALYRVITTTTVTTAPDSPVGTVITSTETFLSIDYSEIYASIDTNLLNIKLNLDTLSQSFSDIKSYQETIKTLAEGDGIHITGPYEWLSMAAIYRLFTEQGVDFNSLKQQVDSLPKQQGFE